MGFRFRKSLRILPGLRLNIGKKGVSMSVGGRGASVNVSKSGVRGTVGIPGTGLSWSETIRVGRRGRGRDSTAAPGTGPGGGRATAPGTAPNQGASFGCIALVVIIVVCLFVFSR